MKFSIFTVMLPDWDPATAVKKLKAYGYDGVEWRVTNTKPEVKNDAPSYWGNNHCTVELDTILEKAKEIKKLTDDAGIATAALAGYHGYDNVEATEKMLKAAKIMGAPLIRVGAARYDGSRHFDELFKESRKGYEEVAKMAGKAKVKACVETHMGMICASASGARRLLDGLDPKAVGVIYDPGNMVTEGYEDTRMGLQILGPYLAHVHGKNGVWLKNPDAKPGEHPWTSGFHTPVDEGIVNWTKVLKALKDVGFNGYISFEDFSKVRTTEEKVKFNIEYIKSKM